MNTSQELYHVAQVADICGVSKETVRRWDDTGRLNAIREEGTGYRVYSREQLLQFEEARLFFESHPTF